MTVMAERGSSRLSVDMFERIAEFAEHEDETVRFEFINGRIGLRKVTNGNHGAIIMWLVRQCMQARPELDLSPVQGLKVESYRKGRARPDAVLAPRGTFAGKGDWADTEGVIMAVEVTSYDSDTHRRDREEKPAGYADAGIPYYLLIDRDDCSVTLFSDPSPTDGYQITVKKTFGHKLSLPEPLGIELGTEELKRYVD